MDSLFIARSRVSTREYMRDGEDVREEIDLVWAKTEAEAESKIQTHYQAQSTDYGTTYFCIVLSIKPALA